MKTKKMLTLMLAVMLLATSLVVTVHADVNEYDFDGKCKKFFTTKRYLELESKEWSVYDAFVICDSLTFTKSTSYSGGFAVLMKENGVEYGSAVEIQDGDELLLDVPRTYEYTKVQVRFIHPYYEKHKTAASYQMHIIGSVHLVACV